MSDSSNQIIGEEELLEETHELVDNNFEKFQEHDDDEYAGILVAMFGEEDGISGWTRRDDTDAEMDVLIGSLRQLIDDVDEEVHLQSDGRVDRGELIENLVMRLMSH